MCIAKNAINFDLKRKMSKDSGTFEQLFKDRLYHHQVDPPAHLWGAISSRRKAVSNRKWLLLLLLILLLISSLVFVLLSLGEEEVSPFAMQAISNDDIVKTELSSDLKAEDLFSALLLENAEGRVGDYGRSYSNAIISSVPGASEAGEWSLRNSRFFSDSGDSEIIYEDAVESYSLASGSRQYVDDESKISYGSYEMQKARVDMFSRENSIDEALAPDYETGFLTETEIYTDTRTKDAHPKAERDILSEMALLNFLSNSSSGLIEKSKSGNQLDYEFNVCVIPRNPICFDSRYPLRFFAIDLLAGPDFFDKLIEPKSRDYQEFADMRLASESASFSYGAMARFSAVFQNGLALRTGIAVNQINEKFTWKDPDAVNRRVVNVLIDTIINAPMDTTFVFDTLSIVESGTRVREIHNRYQMIDIPFLIGAEFHNGNWTFTSSIGVMFNIAFEKSGEILAENGQPLVINNNEAGSDVFRTSLGMSFSGSFGVGYRISPQYSILIEPRVKYQLKPLTLDNYVLNQNYFIFGVHAGLRYKFK